MGVPCSLLAGFNKGTPKREVQKGTTGEPSPSRQKLERLPLQTSLPAFLYKGAFKNAPLKAPLSSLKVASTGLR